jgi:RNA polymerase sigma-70 factor (ECF subfamily)
LKLNKTENIDELVNRCRRGDRSAQYRLYLDYADVMFAICKRMVLSVPDAEDILQDAFVIAFSRIDKLKDKHRFGGWLKRITINECVNFLKRKSLQFEALNESMVIEDDDGNEMWNIDLETIKLAIAELPEGGG